MTDSTQFEQAHAYLVGLYGETPKGLIWIGGHADGWRGRTFTSADSAAAYAIELDDRGREGVYHRSTTLAKTPDKRGEAADSHMVHYFALDVDVRGPGHKAESLPETFEDAVRLVEEAGFPAPTVWISSGGGFYPQWRFAEPIDVREPEMRAWVQSAFSAMAAHFITAAGRLGWHLDNVRDLARVFRMPGTTNRKAEPVIARAVDGSGEKFDLGALAAIAHRAATKPRESAPTAAVGMGIPSAGAGLFDDPDRIFTRTEAKKYLKQASATLGETRAGFNSAINNFALACAHFPWLVDREACAKQMVRVLGPKTGWTEPDHADRATINSAYSATEEGRSWTATEQPEGEQAAAGAEGEVIARTLPPPARPLDVARELKTFIPHTDGVAHRAWWQGDFYRWTGAHWEAEEQAAVEKWLYRQTGDAVYQVPEKQSEKEKAEGKKPTFTDMPWAPTRKKIGDLAHALGVGELQREGEEDRGVLAVTNGVIEHRQLLAHSPGRFNLFSLPFDYDPAATAPGWLEFLEQVLPGDRQAQEFLGEWFGYVISGRTDQQKIAALIGKKRCGKGTIARVLTALVGKENVSGMNLGLLSGTFGLEPFVGAALATASDVRWQSRTIGDAIPILLEVSGEDHVTVSRKNKSAWKGRLGVRFMLMSNDTPTFSDRSGALVDRMLYVSFRQSFFGRENVSLTEKLMEELPGILNWALDGLDRLSARGRFTQPDSGRDEQESTRRLADPIGAFIEDWCSVGPGQEIELDHLFLKYQNWCEGEGRKRDSTTKEIFSRDLRSKIDDLTVDRVRVNGKRTRILKGISSDAV